MKVFTIVGFKGHWPVGTAGVVVADTEYQARMLFDTRLKAIGLPGLRDQEVEFTELDTDHLSVKILLDGDY